MPKTLRRIVVILLVIAAVAAAFWWFNRPKPISVALVEVERGKVEATVSNTRAGSVEACTRTKLSPISGGRITYLGVKKGDHVKKGQVLLRLWSEDQEAEQKLAEAQVAAAKKRVAEACSLASSAEREAARSKRLRERGFISEAGEEKSRYEAQSRGAACEAARADVAQAQARVNVTRVVQGKTEMVAPFDGTVADIVGELGEYTTPSPPGIPTPPAIDLIDASCLYIEAPMDEVDAPKLKVGQPARISVDALPGQILPGHVRRVAPYVLAVEKQARTVDVEVALENEQDIPKLLVGYSADVEVVLDSHDNVLRIPTSTVLEGNKVLLYIPDSKTLEERAIKPGITNWEYTEVLDGLQQGDRIAASLEREGVKAGAKVVPEDSAQKIKK
ncbi:MAG TPA: efflux RND transporter periplasmic adaptor subunit [Methylophilaceae bacterium]|nr:efflux RND transporter periplasmic adaptor subunit [Methylophilaceae bacterium]